MTRTHAEDFLRRLLDTYERRDLDTLWTFYDADCRFPVLERFDGEPVNDQWTTEPAMISLRQRVRDEVSSLAVPAPPFFWRTMSSGPASGLMVTTGTTREQGM